jgi:DNA-binding MarR family transcriptional regulator
LEKADNKDERNNRIHAAHIKYGYTLKEIVEHLGIHYCTVVKAIKELEENISFSSNSFIIILLTVI